MAGVAKWSKHRSRSDWDGDWSVVGYGMEVGEMNCPNEHGELRRVKNVDRVIFNGIPVEFEAEHFTCDVCGFTADDLAMAASNQMALFEAWRLVK